MYKKLGVVGLLTGALILSAQKPQPVVKDTQERVIAALTCEEAKNPEKVTEVLKKLREEQGLELQDSRIPQPIGKILNASDHARQGLVEERGMQCE